MKMTNKKGFTLIELLAVIVIMGILMMTAIPAMSSYIDNSRRDTFLDTAKQAVSSARYSMLNEEYSYKDNGIASTVSMPEMGACVLINYRFINLDKGGPTDNSPWGKKMCTSDTNCAMWVLVRNAGTVEKGKYDYYFLGTDTFGNGTDNNFVAEKSIRRSGVTKRNSNSKIAKTPTLTSGKIGGVTCTSIVTVDDQN